MSARKVSNEIWKELCCKMEEEVLEKYKVEETKKDAFQASSCNRASRDPIHREKRILMAHVLGHKLLELSQKLRL